METPFSKHLREIDASHESAAQGILNQAPTSAPQQPTNILSHLTGGGNVQQAGDTAELKLVESKFNSSKDQIGKVAYALRNQVQQGLISPSDASVQMSKFVNDATESHFPGFGEVNRRNKAQEVAQTYQVDPNDAMEMLNQGFDPEQLSRAATLNNAVGVLSPARQGSEQGGM